MKTIRSARNAARLMLSILMFTRSERRLGLAIVLLLTPALMLLATAIGAVSPFVVYPFI